MLKIPKNNKIFEGIGMAKKSRNKNYPNNFNIKFMPRLVCYFISS